ncbi:MAG: RidA family protein [Pseudomonadales bacterium]
MRHDDIEHIGGPVVISGKELSVTNVVRAGNLLFLSGQIPFTDGVPMIDGTIEEQTRSCIKHIRNTLAACNCDLSHVVKSMVWLKSREDFPGFDVTYREYFSSQQPARSALVSDFLVDVRIEIECIAYLKK